MDRRTFIASAFGLTVLVAAGAVAGQSGRVQLPSASAGNVVYTTPATGEPEDAAGPLMMAGVSLVETSNSQFISAFYGDTELFCVNPTGAVLVRLADGTRTLDAIAAEAAEQGHPCEPLDVALFFSSLDQAGYLRNHLLVSVREQA